MSHANKSSRFWMSRVTYEWVTNESCSIRMSDVTCECSTHIWVAYKWVMSQSRMNESCCLQMQHICTVLMDEFVMGFVYMILSRINESCHIILANESYNESCHILMSPVPYQWVLSRTAKPCHTSRVTSHISKSNESYLSDLRSCAHSMRLCVWMSHVTHQRAHRVMSHTVESLWYLKDLRSCARSIRCISRASAAADMPVFVQVRNVTHMNESCHIYKSVMSHIR